MTSTTATGGIGSMFQTQTSKADTGKSLFTSNSEMYLQLFLTQLKNQDPTQPFDTAQMTEQLSQLNSSQQLIDTNKNLETLISLNKNNQASSLAGFINKDVEFLGDTFYLNETGSQKITYIIKDNIENANIEVRNENKDLIFKAPAAKVAGNNEYVWDGKDALGERAPAGTYKISVVTQDGGGEFSTASTFLSGKVTGIDFASSKEPILFIGDDKNRIGVDLSRVSSVSEKSGTLNANNTNSNI